MAIWFSNGVGGSEQLAAKEYGGFQQVQDSFHEESNIDKNSSLYVDYGETFRSPLEAVDEDTFLKVRTRNEEFMSMTWPKVEMLNRWKTDLTSATADVAALVEALELDKVKRGDAEEFKAFRSSLEQRIRDLARGKKFER
jgi:hypothetical protein